MEQLIPSQLDRVSSLAHDLGDVHINRTDDILLAENVDFKGLLLPDYILKGLSAAYFQRPSPIQLRAIPLLRLGLDLIVQGKSGTGKTLVIGVAALETVKIEIERVQAVIIAPTREIALQIRDFIKTISQGQPGLKAEAFVGGLSKNEDRKNLMGCHIAIGTPGRLRDLMKSKYLCLKWVQLLILDEADKLMEKELFQQVKSICKQLPASKQTILCSATFQNPLQEYVACQMKEPFWVSSEGATRLREGNLQPHNAVPMVLLGVRHFLKDLPASSNVNRLLQIKLGEILIILSRVGFSQCLIFSNYQTRAETICNLLVANGWPAMSIRGQDEQSQRMAAISALKEFRCRVLLSTDVTSRGIDIKGVDLVINLDIPYDSATYLHRTGRAGRFGSHGTVITLASGGKELAAFKKIIAEIPDVKVLILPEDMEIGSCDNVALVSVSSGNDVICQKVLCEGEERSGNTKVGSDYQNFHSVISVNDNGEKAKAVIEEANSRLAEALYKPHPLQDSPFHSFEELEEMLSTWVPDAVPEFQVHAEKSGIFHNNWWTSADVVLFEADQELRQIINLKDKYDCQPKGRETEKFNKSCASTFEALHSSIEQLPKYKKNKDNQLKSKSKVRKNIRYQTEQPDVEWTWDSDCNLYYTWDLRNSCCFYFNPWTRVYYKYESDIFYKWNEEIQSYETWDSDSNCFISCSSGSKQSMLSSESRSNDNQCPQSTEDDQYWNWFMMWNQQIKQIYSYVQYLDYCNGLYNNCKRFNPN